MSQEKRRAPRLPIALPIRVVGISGQACACVGHTRDIGAGGVSFYLSTEIPVGENIDYEITLSSNGLAARIRCTGRVLRCVQSGETCTIAVTMERYSFIRPESDVATGTPEPAPPVTANRSCGSGECPTFMHAGRMELPSPA